MIDLLKYTKGHDYRYNEDIEPLIDHPDHTTKNCGEEFTCGKTFIVISDEYDNTLSFVLDGYSNEGIYKLIWKG